MKANQKFRLAAALLAALFFSSSLLAGATSQAAWETPSFPSEDPGKPGKKKCHRCAAWRPDRLFKKGQLDATLGVGIVSTFLMDGARIWMPPVAAGLEYRFGERFSLGFAAGHSVSESKPKLVSDGVSATWTNHFTHLALRPGIHVVKSDNWDFYGGFSIGLGMTTLDGSSSSPEFDLQEYESHVGIRRKKTDFTYTGFVGLRYVVSPKWSLGGELGFGVSIFTVGATYLLN